MKIIVIGGGASGLIAGIIAKKNCDDVTILEKQGRVGRKLSQTGNGRCNLLNVEDPVTHYHGTDPDFIKTALSKYTPEIILGFFQEIGLLTILEYGGRVYPYTSRADSVVDMLRFSCMQQGVKVLTDCTVTKVEKHKGSFLVRFQTEDGKQTLDADKVILCTGGPAAAKLGATQDGIGFCKAFGHSAVPFYPCLVPLKATEDDCKALKGIRANAAVTAYAGKELLRRSEGEIQFAEYGISGPAVFDISGFVSSRRDCIVKLDLVPQKTDGQMFSLLRDKCEAYPFLTVNDLLSGILQNRLGRMVCRRAGLSFEKKLFDLTDQELKKVSHQIKEFVFHISGNMGLDAAQVAGGGLRTDEFYPESMESRLVHGLYACGELLDVFGDCGGFNLRWAFASAMAAAEHASREE